MKSQDIENMRYQKEEHCPIRMEENIMFGFLAEFARQRKRKPEEIRILDIGCGSGNIMRHLSEKGYQLKGVDFSEEALKRAKANGLDVAWCNLDEGIPEADSSFDVVLAGDIIEHLFDPIFALKEIKRVLKDDGVLLGTLPNDVGLMTRLMTLFGISYQEHMYMWKGYYKHHTFFSPRLMKFMIDAAGMKITKQHNIFLHRPKSFRVRYLPSAFYNEVVFRVEKKNQSDMNKPKTFSFYDKILRSGW